MATKERNKIHYFFGNRSPKKGSVVEINPKGGGHRFLLSSRIQSDRVISTIIVFFSLSLSLSPPPLFNFPDDSQILRSGGVTLSHFSLIIFVRGEAKVRRNKLSSSHIVFSFKRRFVFRFVCHFLSSISRDFRMICRVVFLFRLNSDQNAAYKSICGMNFLQGA